MVAVLFVCTGNVCRSPIAEGMLRSLLEGRFGDAAPSVGSAGTAGWAGSPADPSSVVAAADLGVDISAHRARQLERHDVRHAAVILAMAGEHAHAASRLAAEAAGKVFTLKELVRLLEALPEPARGSPSDVLTERVHGANSLRRRGVVDRSWDTDVADPLGMPLETFRAVAWELEQWCGRLADGLFGRAPDRTGAFPEGN